MLGYLSRKKNLFTGGTIICHHFDDITVRTYWHDCIGWLVT